MKNENRKNPSRGQEPKSPRSKILPTPQPREKQAVIKEGLTNPDDLEETKIASVLEL